MAAAFFLCSSCGQHSYFSDGERLRTLPAAKKTERQSDLLYSLLAAEFSLQAGDWQAAAENYMRAARQTDELPVLKHALVAILQAQDYKKAAELGARLLKYPLEPRVKIAVAAIYLQEGRAQKAVRVVRELLEEGASSSLLFARLYQMYIDISNFSGSYAALERFAGYFPEEAEAQLFLATVAYHMVGFDQALAAVDRVLEIRADDPSAYVLKARLMVSHGRLEEGFSYWRQALIKLPKDIDQRAYYAQTLLAHNYFQEAYDELLYLHFKLPDYPHYIKALGQAAMKRENYDHAQQWFARLAQYEDYAEEALYFQGRLAEERADYERALALYDQVSISDNTLYREAQSGIVRIHQLRGDINGALEYIERARAASDNYRLKLDFYLVEGEVLRNAGLIQREFDLYTQAINNHMDTDTLLYARALAASRLNYVDVLERDIRRILLRSPNNPQALNALGYELANRNIRLQEAKRYIVRAHNLAPEDPAILDSMGWIEFRLKNFNLAESYVRRAMLRLYEAEIVGHLVEIMRVQSRHQEAERILDKALTDFPDDEYLNRLFRQRPQ